MLDILQEKVYWLSMYANTDHWISQCERYPILKGDYTEPKTQQGSLIAQQPLELLCIDSCTLVSMHTSSIDVSTAKHWIGFFYGAK